MIRRFWFIAFFWLLAAASEAAVTIKNVRLWPAPDRTTVVLDLSGPVRHEMQVLKDPDRLVIDLHNTRWRSRIPLKATGDIMTGVRHSVQPDGKLRIVFDLKRAVRPRAFVLKPAGQYGHRLMLELNDLVTAQAEPEPPPVVTATITPAPPVAPAVPAAPKVFVVAIDAGHGGEDPGAIGRTYRTREKDVTLGIARELARLVNQTPGMRAVMTRDGDYYVGLRERTRKANRHNADIFISIHADSMPGKRAHLARGSSVYALSERGATSELAKALADDENSSDWVGGVAADDVDNDVRKVLGDLTKTATIIDSLEMGVDMLTSLRSVGPLHSDTVAQAGFMVLKTPMPSVLVETAFISNPNEERLLRNPAHQRRIAEGIHRGLLRASPRLLARRGAPDSTAHVATSPTQREHVVKQGETLRTIARHYDVHVEVLRFLNDLSDEPAAGTRLRLPATARGG